MQSLVRNSIIDSLKGPSGGFEISPLKMNQIKLSEIVAAIDGDEVYNGCGLGLSKCCEKQPCPIHDKFSKIRNELKFMLENTTIEELANGTSEGATFLMR